jgi:hypothetical protein
LAAVREALPEAAGWCPPDDVTTRNILAAAGTVDPDATIEDIARRVRQIIISRRFRGWGGVVEAIRKRW